MGCGDVIRNVGIAISRSFGKGSSASIQPAEILAQVLGELERRKKLGIEEYAYVPNIYIIYLNPVDREELSPFLVGIRDQLKNRIMEKIRKRGYKLLSPSVSIEIREDRALERNEVVVDSSFLKEKGVDSSTIYQVANKPQAHSAEDIRKRPESLPQDGGTRIVEEKRTKIIDDSRLKLEIVQGDGKGDVIALKQGEYTFGRGNDARILLKDKEETISRVHFKISVKEGNAGIKDLKSTNGTRVNGIEIEESELKKGDIISAGKTVLRIA
jgi:hypothetical protein